VIQNYLQPVVLCYVFFEGDFQVKTKLHPQYGSRVAKPGEPFLYW
jgi:hypothetical protein